jgi:hypothetical protein
MKFIENEGRDTKFWMRRMDRACSYREIES